MLKTSCRSFKTDYAVCKFINLGVKCNLDIHVVQICAKDNGFVLFYKGEEADIGRLNEIFEADESEA